MWLKGRDGVGCCRNHHELLSGRQDQPRRNSVSRGGLLLDSRLVGRLAAQVQHCRQPCKDANSFQVNFPYHVLPQSTYL